MKRLACCALLLAAVATTPAYADDCGGKLLVSKPMKTDAGRLVGHLEFYYNAQNGNNCAVTRHSQATQGTLLYTSVSVVKCNNESCSVRTYDPDFQDSGNRRDKAGPVRRYGKKICLGAVGRINIGGEAVIADTRGFCD